jgi:arsenate reductase
MKKLGLNFICTHNSRRSHLSQIWAQTMAYYYQIEECFLLFWWNRSNSNVSESGRNAINQGFEILKLSETENPVYAVKFAENEHAVICFSKNMMMI